nr:EpsG family protein [Gibbsiella quercinecans]
MFLAYIASAYKSNKLDNITVFLVAIMMVCFYGFRTHGTPDIKMYLGFFDQMKSFSDFPWGYGFYIINAIIKEINKAHWFYVFSTSLLFVSLLLIVSFKFLKEEPYKALLMLSFFNGWYILDLATNTIRQGLALPFIMLSFYCLCQRKKLMFMVFFAISMAIHWGALVPLSLGVVAYYISKRRVLLVSLTYLTIFLYVTSFLVNLDIARMLVDNPIVNSLQSVFVGVNLTSKVYAYLNSDTSGTQFYQIPLLTKLKFTAESFVPLLVNVVFFLTRKKQDPFFQKNSMYLPIYSFIILLTMYAVSIISMAWFFRNFYWSPILSMVSVMMIISYFKGRMNYKVYVLLCILCILFVSMLANWTSELLRFSYPA